MSRARTALALGLAAALAGGCATVGALTSAYGRATGQQDLVDAGQSMQRSGREFSPSQQYYLGRTVACRLLADWPPSQDLALQRYVGQVGQTVALACQQPQQYRGWHFILVKGAPPAAFSTPGGFVIISEGLVRLCDNEDELAAVLAHECSHVALGHPLQAISEVNRQAALLSLARFGIGQVVKGSELSSLTDTFNASVGQVMQALAHGYDRQKEYAADASAVGILDSVGYDPRALEAVLRKLPYGGATHGDPRQRAAAVEEVIARLPRPLPALDPARTRRFRLALGR